AATVGARVALGPGIWRGTARIRESDPARVAQPPGFASVRGFGTMRAERTRPAESAANELANGYECGAISSSSRTPREASFNSGPEERSSGPLPFLPCFSEGL